MGGWCILQDFLFETTRDSGARRVVPSIVGQTIDQISSTSSSFLPVALMPEPVSESILAQALTVVALGACYCLLQYGGIDRVSANPFDKAAGAAQRSNAFAPVTALQPWLLTLPMVVACSVLAAQLESCVRASPRGRLHCSGLACMCRGGRTIGDVLLWLFTPPGPLGRVLSPTHCWRCCWMETARMTGPKHLRRKLTMAHITSCAFLLFVPMQQLTVCPAELIIVLRMHRGYLACLCGFCLTSRSARRRQKLATLM